MRISIPSMKVYTRPGYLTEIVYNVFVRTGNYAFTFEEFLYEGEESIEGKDMLHRATARGAVAGLQHGLWLIDNPQVIPEEHLRSRTLVLVGTVGMDVEGRPIIPNVSWDGRKLMLSWYWLKHRYSGHHRLVRAQLLEPK